MKIILIYLGRKGGGALYSLEMAKAISNKLDLEVVISKYIENKQEWYKIGIKITEVDTYNSLKSAILSTIRIGKFLKLRSYICKSNVDIIYYPMISPWLPIINFMTKHIPKVYTLHDPKLHIGEENIILSNINKNLARNASRCIILSEIFKKDMNSIGVDERKVDVIPHGEFSYYNKTKLKRNFNRTLLFFGRIHKYKGIEVLLKAFKIINMKNKDIHLLIVGNGKIDKYKEDINNLTNIEVVNRWINDNEVEKFFLRSDVLVAPYIDASQSGVIPTAYGFGMPVIASKIGGITEQVEDGKTGFLVKPGDEHELAKRCIQLLKNENMVMKMGHYALMKSKKELNWDNIGDMLIESFKKLKDR